ncbi:MAG: zinc-ribbon domain containing protein [Pirellulaceae bacterium]
MSRKKDPFANYVEHPRYGRGPRLTGRNPVAKHFRAVHIHWNATSDTRIPNTAVTATTCNQRDAIYPVTHYYDVKRCCVDCGRMFIFFAEEQRYWYEVLRFKLDADCKRCVPCRIVHRSTCYLREQYERLLEKSELSEMETCEVCDCALTLIERGEFGNRVIQRVRALLNSIDSDSKIRNHATFRDLTLRVDRLADTG